jgi:CDP-diacylglycerol--serine O-phosphatidyltransferase
MPSPAGGIIVLLPLILSFSGLGESFFKINYDLLVPISFVIVSILLISTIPTYSFKKIVIPRTMTKFLLFGIVIFFGALLVYTFKILALSSFLYLCLIPISYFHFKKIKKRKNIINEKNESEELEDIL